MKIEQYDDSVRKNRKAILEALTAIKAERATVSYSGSGDSGQMDGVEIEGAESDCEDIMIDFEEESSKFNHDTKTWDRSTSTVQKPLSEAIESLCYDLLAIEHSGWENNDGGDGTFDFDVKEGKIKWTHNKFYTESNTTEHEY